MIRKLKNQRNIIMLLLLTSLTFHLIFGLEGQARIERLESELYFLKLDYKNLANTKEYYEYLLFYPRPEAEQQSVVYDISLSKELQEYTYDLCKEYEVDYELVLSVMAQESNYQEDTVSLTGDYGIMQINSCNHDWLSQALNIDDFLDAKQNILAGVYILKDLSSRYDNEHEILMAYNHGEYGAKRKWREGIVTTAYSRGIIARKNELKEIEND